ncbi:MAG: arylsulfatase, partial [Candidatus Hodarchaeota archaeon]
INDRKRPNVVFVLTDDQGYGDIACLGNEVIKTPNIDAFYKESVRLTNYHVGPTCAPTRSTLLTGHYANSTGVWHTIGGRSLLRKNEVSIADVFKENGYKTGIFGKWHLGDSYPYRPQDRGFEEVIVHGGGGISQTPDYWGNDYFDDTYRVNGGMKKFEGYCTDVWFDEAIKFIEKYKDTPFFCYIPTNAPHWPYNIEKKYSGKYKGKVPDERANFYGMIENIDENLSRLRNKLRELGIEDNTILIFSTDNGTSCGTNQDMCPSCKKTKELVFGLSSLCFDCLGVSDEEKIEEGLYGYNAGLRGKKGSEYDGGHRVPLFLRWPRGDLYGPKDVNILTASIDLMPTLIELCGLESTKDLSFHGKSIVPLLRGQEENWEERAVVTDSQRLVYPIKWRKSAVMTNRWRLINGEELYDIGVDRGQENNVSVDHPRVVEELRKEYEKWWEIVSRQFDEEISISIGSVKEKVTIITSHDMRNDLCNVAWNQGIIRRGHVCNGYWEILVEKDGDYIFELRRWPREKNKAIVKGIKEDNIEWRKDCISENDAFLYSGGKALDFKKATLRIGDEENSKEVLPGDKFVEFLIPLKAGNYHLQAWFSNNEGIEIGAYYIYVYQKE